MSVDGLSRTSVAFTINFEGAFTPIQLRAFILGALEDKFSDRSCPAELMKVDWMTSESGHLTLGGDFDHEGDLSLVWLCDTIQAAITDLFDRPGSRAHAVSFDWLAAYRVNPDGSGGTQMILK